MITVRGLSTELFRYIETVLSNQFLKNAAEALTFSEVRDALVVYMKLTPRQVQALELR